MYTPKRTKLQFKILFEEAPGPRAGPQQYHIYVSGVARGEAGGSCPRALPGGGRQNPAKDFFKLDINLIN